ncbi:hypothetical protein [uncultured Methanobrevibacter sp.]|uniref:hypothetical protein n=1 Tax=uncultured Methanobrevibacter sp. TaxID=253161 RepID=UPI0025D9EE55|nr:hypothetical protein [uncultured Methanobrevibacter sp.]
MDIQDFIFVEFEMNLIFSKFKYSTTGGSEYGILKISPNLSDLIIALSPLPTNVKDLFTVRYSLPK